MNTVCRGIRGATTVESDSCEEILCATRKLLATIIYVNDINPDDVASLFITSTPDLTSVYPALAARQLGWLSVPLLGASEIAIAGGLPYCIRILVHWNTAKTQDKINHVYQGNAQNLRPDQARDLSVEHNASIEQWIEQKLSEWKEAA